ncbi:MAG: hypothetical protein M3Y33_14030 [Actinomycetota bacterium]|nr:hypothetical protein [Actinomycetota bacterium]
MTETPACPVVDESAEITLATLRDWADWAVGAVSDIAPGALSQHALGWRNAARCVQAILDSRNLAAGQPVIMPQADG